ncbi:uncharacterized protein BDR25DRAFT_365080, partial [Lindgomyces ingoldianus]
MDPFWPEFSNLSSARGSYESLLPINPQFSESSPLVPLPSSEIAPNAQSPLNEDGEGSENGRKKRRRIPPDARRVLEECFERHREDPYVPQDEAKNLAARTGLSLKQVRTFFANARARKLPPPSSHNTSSGGTHSMDIPGSTTGSSQKDPMERFLSSSPEDEGISEDAVQRAAESLSPTNSSSPSLRRHPGVADTMSVSDATFSSSSRSSSSQASIDSTNSRGPRRGRKRQREHSMKDITNILREPSDPYKIYQCTFCTSDFSQKYDWRRHEESVHFPQKEWVCIPDGPTYDLAEGGIRCAFCDENEPSNDHFDLHNCAACISAPRFQQTFTRKDKLQQHLVQVHRLAQFSKTTQSWHRPIERKITLACGLCGSVLADWQTRADHIASHFSDGVGMDLWLSDPGGIMPYALVDENIKQRYEI